MQAVKKAVRGVIEKEQQRILVLTLSHDGEVIVQGDNFSFSNLEDDATAMDRIKLLLSRKPDDGETSYNFGNKLSYVENQILDFPKMFAKVEGKKWKGGGISKTLSGYLALLNFGLNAKKAYGNIDDKPAWWPRRPKWKNFKNPSKASKDECTLLIRCLLRHYSIDPNMHYVGYPDEELEQSSSDSSDSDDDDDGQMLSDREEREVEDSNDGNVIGDVDKGLSDRDEPDVGDEGEKENEEEEEEADRVTNNNSNREKISSRKRKRIMEKDLANYKRSNYVRK